MTFARVHAIADARKAEQWQRIQQERRDGLLWWQDPALWRGFQALAQSSTERQAFATLYAQAGRSNRSEKPRYVLTPKPVPEHGAIRADAILTPPQFRALAHTLDRIGKVTQSSMYVEYMEDGRQMIELTEWLTGMNGAETVQRCERSIFPVAYLDDVYHAVLDTNAWYAWQHRRHRSGRAATGQGRVQPRGKRYVDGIEVREWALAA